MTLYDSKHGSGQKDKGKGINYEGKYHIHNLSLILYPLSFFPVTA
jgi:hypothetical protein